jgi:hypothetical protein
MHRTLREGAANTADERIANRDEACNGEGIAMTVAPDGKSYTVSVPSTNHRQRTRHGKLKFEVRSSKFEVLSS